MKLSWKHFVFLSFTFTLVTACATPPRPEFATFAKAGSAYAVALDNLLIVAGDLQIDTTSWNLVMNKDSHSLPETIYNDMNKTDKDRLDQLSRLRKHAQLLARYFSLLNDLATSDAPEKVKSSIDGVITNITATNLGVPSPVSAASPIAQVAVEAKLRVELRDELNARKDVIQRELYFLEKLLEKLKGDIEHAITLTQEEKEQTLVINPLISETPLKDPDAWVKTRRNFMQMSMVPEELGKASEAATELRKAFEGLISGEVTMERLNALMADIEGLVSMAENINSKIRS
jgi:hypothetical protein